MGIDYYIGTDEVREQVRITSAIYYNGFLNWVADTAVKEDEDFPMILNYPPTIGKYTKEQVAKLDEEIDRLIEIGPPVEEVSYILGQMKEGCQIAIALKEEISREWIDDGTED